MGLLDAIGAGLDAPWAATGVAPETISADPWARRGMVLSALGSGLIPPWEQGHRPFYGQLGAVANQAQERNFQQEQRAYALQQAQQNQALESQIAAIFGEQPAAAQQAPEPQMPQFDTGAGGLFESQLSGGSQPMFSQAPAAAPMSPQKIMADKYRKVAAAVAAKYPDRAMKYVEMAEKIDPAGADAKMYVVDGNLVGQNGQVAFTAPARESAPPEAIKLMREFGIDPASPQGIATYERWKTLQAPKTTISNTINGKADAAFAETLATAAAKELPELYKQAQTAASVNQSLNTVIGLAEKGTFSGPLAPGAIGAAQFLQSMGVNVAPETLTSSRMTEAVLNDLTMQTLAANGGAKGFTKEEMPMIYNAMPKLADDPQTRIALARYLQKKNAAVVGNYQARRDSAKKLPMFEAYGTPEVALPRPTPEGRPRLSDIFTK